MKLKTTEEFIKQAKNIHNDRYDYKLVNYINASSKVILVCKKHGEFSQEPNSHLKGHGCSKCRYERNGKLSRLTLKDFIDRSNIIHNFKYDYSKVIYSASNKKVKIICPIHEQFLQKPNNHLLGSGCIKCGMESTSYTKSQHSVGWGKSRWISSANKSNNFDSFKVYIVKIYNDKESFFKIGRTFRKVGQRFRNLPKDYRFKIYNVIESEDGDYIFNLEAKLKKSHKHLLYIPKIKFGGMYECFSKIEIG